MTKIFVAGCIYALVCIFFTIYSYSQIDLNLTLSSYPLYQSFQHNLILLGYFNRPLSSFLFVILVLLLFGIYGYILSNLGKSGIKNRDVWKILLPIYSIVFFAYPAFSHDIYNYMFDARIVTMYGASPYEFTALDFPNDLWTRFMHWTHRTYPYGPTWLLLTIPFSLLGLNKFVLTLFFFKLIFLFSTIGSVYLINEITKKILPKRNNFFAMLFFGLNPLVIMEGIISPHNDIVMFFIALSGIYFLLNKKQVFSYALLFVSAGIKFLSIAYLPFMIISKKINHDLLFILMTLSTILVLIPVVSMREFYPWYFVPIVGFMSIVRYRSLHLFTIFFTLALVLRYVPYLYFGDYIPQAVYAQNFVFASVFIVACLVAILDYKKIVLNR